jgi:hypothetical protein
MLKKWICLMLAGILALNLASCVAADAHQDPTKQSEATHATRATESTEELIQEETLADPEEAILGSYLVYIYITEENSGLEGFVTEAGLPAVVTFLEDGTATMNAYEPLLEEAYTALEQDLCDYILQLKYEQLQDAGYTHEEADKRFERYNGITLEEYAHREVKKLELEKSFLELNMETTYEIRDYVLILGEKQELPFELRTSSLIMLSSSDPEYWQNHGMQFPVVLLPVEIEEEVEEETEELA